MPGLQGLASAKSGIALALSKATTEKVAGMSILPKFGLLTKSLVIGFLNAIDLSRRLPSGSFAMHAMATERLGPSAIQYGAWRC